MEELDCSPTNRERELGLDRRETGWFYPPATDRAPDWCCSPTVLSPRAKPQTQQESATMAAQGEHTKGEAVVVLGIKLPTASNRAALLQSCDGRDDGITW